MMTSRAKAALQQQLLLLVETRAINGVRIIRIFFGPQQLWLTGRPQLRMIPEFVGWSAVCLSRYSFVVYLLCTSPVRR